MNMIKDINTIILILLVILCTGCAITYEPHRCELMLRGEQCLSDHRCCNPPQTYYHDNYPKNNWWYLTRPTYTNYVIIKPNKPNKPNNNRPKPNRKPKHRK